MENIAKKVIIKSSGVCFGYVLDVVLDENFSKKGYYVVDERSESEFFLNAKDVIVAGDVLLVEEENKLEFVPQRNLSLLSREVIGAGGVNLGRVQKLEFGRNKCTKIITEKCEILPKNISFVGEDVIFVQSKKAGKKRAFKTKDEVFPEIEVSVQQSKSPTFPEKINLSTKFFLGKVSEMDVFGYNNERIVARGEKISRAVVEKAKLHNKLNQLFFAINQEK